MSATSRIEWTDTTWNPVAGCTHVSAGCDHCYAARQASGRLKNSATYVGLAEDGRFTGMVRLLPDRLAWPLRKRNPLRIFVNSMSDLFHADIPDEFIARVFAVMAMTPQHTYQLLTKRHARMRSLLGSATFHHQVAEQGRTHLIGCQQDWLAVGAMLGGQPLPNVWLGVSAEDQATANLRIPALLETPAVVRFVSAEPLLGPIDLTALQRRPGGPRIDALAGDVRDHDGTIYAAAPGCLDWVIVGGESGTGARPMHPDWARSLRDQTTQAGRAFLFKQWGEWLGYEPDAQPPFWTAPNGNTVDGHIFPPTLSDGDPVDGWWAPEPADVVYQRAGKKAAGRALDGHIHDDYPADRPPARHP